MLLPSLPSSSSSSCCSGHDSIFESNVVVVRAYDAQNCINGNNAFVPGHHNVLVNNTCAVQGGRHPWDWDLVMPAGGDGGVEEEGASPRPHYCGEAEPRAIAHSPSVPSFSPPTARLV